MRRNHRLREIALIGTIGLTGACQGSLTDQLRDAIAEQRIEPLDHGRRPDEDLVALGEALFYDKELSGNRDVSCGTCHHPASRTGDGLSLSIGTGGVGVGTDRQLGSGNYLLRNAPDLFDRGADGWETLFWDGRIELGEPWPLPDGVTMPTAIGDDLLAAQVMTQIAHRDTMRGYPGDVDVDGTTNSHANNDDNALPVIWEAVMARLLAIDEYVALFADAFPDVPRAELGFEHAALAISAYQVGAFSLPNSQWDRFIEGEDGALVDAAKRGGILFYGDARCGECHSGTLMTDQDFHNVCTPQVGTGLDWGRGGYTGLASERYAFRTPPLRGVSFTAPYFHAGTHRSLEELVEYHIDPCTQMRTYTGEDLEPRFQQLLVSQEELFAEIEQTADPIAQSPINLSREEIADIVQFLESTSDPDVVWDITTIAPASVPSGRPVD
ncbi:MAG: cytochrome c peroxidase [Myxococcota bacterium]